MDQNKTETATHMRNWTVIVEEAIEQALNAAADAARNHPHDIAAVERVRGYLRKRFAQLEVGRISGKDAMLVLALLMSAVTRGVFEDMQVRFRTGE